MRIAIAGSGRLGLGMMLSLMESQHEIVAMVQDGRHTRGWKRRMAPAKEMLANAGQTPYYAAARLHVPAIWIDKMTPDELAPLAAIRPDILLVGGFSIILKRPILDLPTIGCLNVHSSLLPKHRGPNPFAAVVQMGETESGVTFHVMDEGIDTGDIVAQYAFPVERDATLFNVYNRSCAVAAAHIVEVMDRIETDGLHGTPQDPQIATYDQRPTPETARIDWRMSAFEIDCLVRACAPSPMPHFDYKGQKVCVLNARCETAPVDAAPGAVLRNRPLALIATGDGAIRLMGAYIRRPVPWMWPSPWSRPAIGEILP
jgi:methionyl-tRNA formyltransferase